MSSSKLISNRLAVFAAVVSAFTLSKLNADEGIKLPILMIKPTKCVSLKQDQRCHISVTVSWKVKEYGDYCLFSELQQQAIRCWTWKKDGEITQDIAIDKDVTYSLVKASDKQVVVKQDLRFAWVYKKEKSSFSSWRVF